jgi:hypothetical protein
MYSSRSSRRWVRYASEQFFFFILIFSTMSPSVLQLVITTNEREREVEEGCYRQKTTKLWDLEWVVSVVGGGIPNLK